MAKIINEDDIASLRYEIGEIFTPSAPVNLIELFAGRRKQINQMIDSIAEPGRHIMIYGERGVGKTSLSQVVSFIIPFKNRFLRVIRKPCDPSDTFTSVWKKIFRDIRFDLRDDETGKITTASVDELYPEDVSPYDVVREMKLFGANDVPVIVIDEFNELLDENASLLMANTIKSLSDENVNVTIIIVGVADSVSGLFESHESIDRCCEEVPMPRMSYEELSEIIDKRLSQLNMTIHNDARSQIVTLARGLPMYVHRLGKLSALNAVSNKRTHILETDTSQAIDDMLMGSLESLRNKYHKATHSNQPGNQFKEVLLACAIAQSDDNGFFVPAAIKEPLSKIIGKPMEIAQYQNHLNQFISDKRGKILQRTGAERAYRFRFRDPDMQPYIIMKGIKSEIVSEDIKSILSYPEQPELFPNQSETFTE